MYNVVKYSNWMNELRFNTFDKMDSDFLFTLCATIKNCHSEVIEIPFSYLKKAVHYPQNSNSLNSQFVQDLRRMNKKLLGIQCEMKGRRGVIVTFNLFSTFMIDAERKTLTVRVNPDFAFVLNDLVSEYTKFELDQFISLKSKYSKELYKQLKQWRKAGTAYFPVDELRIAMNCPEKYTMSQFMQKILQPAVKELKDKQCFKRLTLTQIHAKKKGAPVTGCRFTWVKELHEDIAVEDTWNDEGLTALDRDTSLFTADDFYIEEKGA